ncbi:MAG: GMC family oxidoreductase [Archangium sp.]|nr:GMC family oxidoreductase [Archangium sp.]
MFSPSQRTQLELLAGTMLPAGRLLPAADGRTVTRAEHFLSGLPERIQSGYARLLPVLDARALLMHRSRFHKLPLGQRVEVLEALDRNEATRLLLRGLLAPLKLAYFDDPEVYARLNCRFAIEPPLKLEHARWRSQIMDGAELASSEEALECDVVVIGTGAGGAPLAAELAKRGHAVLLLEEGAHHTRKDFNGRAVDAMRKMYRNAGSTIAFGNTAIPIPLGIGVGGTTLINSGTCFRVPDEVLADWRAEGLSDFTPDALAPHYEAVEKFLEVAPSSKAALGKPAELIAKGCDALGYSHHALRRNAPGCDGQGMCCFGCPTDAKRSMNVSYVPAALEAGAQLLTGVKVDRILTEKHAAVGVSATTSKGRLTVRAKAVVVSCGALLTPVLLEQNGLANGSNELGKHLTIHPASAALGVFKDQVNPSRTVPQGYAIDEFAREGIYFEGGTVPLDVTAATLSGFGPSWVSLMEQFDHTFNMGFMVKDTSRGRVRAGKDGTPRITYWLNDTDLKKLQRACTIISRVMFAAGATEVQLPLKGHERIRTHHDIQKLEHASIAARHLDISAYHPLGTARMGVDPLKSVVDSTHETHDVHNLFVVDGSAVPSSLGVNPQLTIMAMSLRAAAFVERRVERLSSRQAA